LEKKQQGEKKPLGGGKGAWGPICFCGGAQGIFFIKFLPGGPNFCPWAWGPRAPGGKFGENWAGPKGGLFGVFKKKLGANPRGESTGGGAWFFGLKVFFPTQLRIKGGWGLGGKPPPPGGPKTGGGIQEIFFPPKKKKNFPIGETRGPKFFFFFFPRGGP